MSYSKKDRSLIQYCTKNGKPCYDKKGAISAKNKRWNQDRIELRVYQCCFDHWHVTKQLEVLDYKRVKYDKNYKKKPKHKNDYE